MLHRTLLRPLTRARARPRPLAHLSLSLPLGIGATSLPFSTTPRLLIKPGDPLPDTDALMETRPGHHVNLAEEAEKVDKMLLIGVPAAFSPACSSQVPGYIHHPRAAEFGEVGVVSVNDVFVMKAWGEAMGDAGDETGDWDDEAEARHRRFRFFADPTGRFTKMLDMEFDGSALFGGKRSKRYAIIIEQGKVKTIAVEPDNTGVNVTLVEKVLGPLPK